MKALAALVIRALEGTAEYVRKTVAYRRPAFIYMEEKGACVEDGFCGSEPCWITEFGRLQGCREVG